LNSGCEYYLFVQRFTSLDDLRLKDTLTGADKIRAFVQACRQETFGGAHELAYVGTYPFTQQEFLDVLFGTQAAVRPKGAFGFDGMTRHGLRWRHRRRSSWTHFFSTRRCSRLSGSSTR
jgi:hypothetical protein